MSKLSTATETGLLICDRISKKGLRFIDCMDPDLHYAIMKELEKKKPKRRRKK